MPPSTDKKNRENNSGPTKYSRKSWCYRNNRIYLNRVRVRNSGSYWNWNNSSL